MESLKKPINKFYLPQVSAPYKFVVSQLNDLGFQHELNVLAVNQLKPLEQDIDLNKVNEFKDVNDEDFDIPVFCDRKGAIVDGRHRVAAKKLKEGDNAKIQVIRLDAEKHDACAIMKIIQDRWEQKQKGLYK